MKNRILVSLMILLVAVTAFTASSGQIKDFDSWWAAKWAVYYGDNVTIPAIPETGVMRDGMGGIQVQYIEVKGEGRESVVITPQGITCIDENRQPRVCQTPVQ